MKRVKAYCFNIVVTVSLILFGKVMGNSLPIGTLLAHESFEATATNALSGFAFVHSTDNKLNQFRKIMIEDAARISTQGLASLSVASSGGKITLNGNDAFAYIPVHFPANSLGTKIQFNCICSNSFYISFLFRSVLEGKKSGYSGLCLANSAANNDIVLIGNSWSSQTTSIVDDSMHAVADLRNFNGTGEFNIADIYSHLVVLRMSQTEKNTHILTAWLDPDPITGEFKQNSPSTYVGTLQTPHGFDQILLHGGTNNPMDFDEIRMGTTWESVLPSPSHSTAEFPNHDFESWPTLFEARLKSIDGYSFMARYKGKVLAYGAKGYARLPIQDHGKGIRWTPQESMHVASVSIAITATAIMKLMEENPARFKLDTAFWPVLKDIFQNASDDSKQITIRQFGVASN